MVGNRMHSFAIDSDERKEMIFGIAIVSILFAWGLGQAQDVFGFSIPWWFDAPSVLGFFGLFYKMINNHLWKSSILGKCGLIKTPDLSGKWIAQICSSYNNFSQPINAEVIIKQNWTTISILFKGSHSRSASRVASILVNHPGQPMLSYEYVNEPNIDAVNTMHMHFGFTRLSLSDDKTTLTGDYYSGRDRTNCGKLILVRQ
jgi:hypothetical protein